MEADGGTAAPRPRGGAQQGKRGGKAAAGGKPARRPKVSTTKREEVEVKQLEARIAAEAPAPGSAAASAKRFDELPLSRYTLTGLQRGKFAVMTQIQRIGIPHALASRDVLGAAKTGSGKTLAFVIPVIERLYRERWTAADGLGAVIVSPTRELAQQIFDVVRTVAQAHFGLTAGVVTGGKPLEEEQAALPRVCLLVATPGRLLQHLEQTAELDTSNLRVLVLDEADRLLDMGFADTLNAILSYLPAAPQRQTLLFSATQTKSVKDLARLSLRQPEYVAVHEAASTATPARLSQSYVVCRLQDKLNMLYSFIRTHLQAKTIVFVSSCKQSRFLFEAFRRLRPGVPLQLLHGKMKQQRRMIVYYDFMKKPAAVLFATDVASRGLDFTGVDWVLQLDCPEDPAAYVHRVGRTARHHSKGHALLVLLPSEAPAMVAKLADARIPLKQVTVNPTAAVSITGKVAAEVAADASLKQLAQRAFTSYIRSVYLQPHKDVFDVTALPTAEFAESLGLATVPAVKLPKAAAGDTADAARAAAHAAKNANRALQRLKESIAARKAQKAGSSSGGGAAKSAAPSTLSGDSSDGGDSSDEDDGRRSVASASSSSADSSGGAGHARRRRHARAGDSSDSSGSDDSDDSDELLHVRGSGRDGPAAGGAGASASASASASVAADLADEERHPVLATLSEHERRRVHAIIRDTREMVRASTRGADGLMPFERIARAKAAEKGAAAAHAKGATAVDPGKLQDAASAYAATVAARLAAAATRDREHERERIHGKHREERLRQRGRLHEDDDADADGGGVVLGGGNDSDSEAADDARSSSGGSYDDAGDGGDSMDGSDAGEGAGDQGHKLGKPAARKRQRAAAADDDEVSERAGNGTSGGGGGGGGGGSVADMEAVALQLMEARSKRRRV